MPSRRRLLGLLAAGPLALAGCSPALPPPHPLQGAPLPDLEFPDLAGQRQRLAAYRGRALLINVWATWCPPCRGEMAGLAALQAALGGRGLQVVGVSVDEDLNLVREYLLQARLGFPVWSDPKGKAMGRLLASPAIPATLLAGRDGRVARVVFGEQDWSAAQPRAWVKEALA